MYVCCDRASSVGAGLRKDGLGNADGAIGEGARAEFRRAVSDACSDGTGNIVFLLFRVADNGLGLDVTR
jgi:hypothetical protein